MTSNILHETEHYILTVGTCPEQNENIYVVTNKEHGVVETRISVWPQAIKFMEESELLITRLPEYLKNLKESLDRAQSAAGDMASRISMPNRSIN